MTLWVLFWTGIVGIFDVVISRGIYHQIRATQFVTTRGEIISSEVESDHDSDGTTYRPKATFEYDADNQTLLGKTIRHNLTGSSDSYAHEFVANHPVGKKVDVHYDPSNPTDAVLVTGLEGSDLFMLMFMTPFNVIMLGGWYFLFSTIRQLVTPENWVRPCRYTDDGYEMRIMIDRVPLIAVVGISLLALCFINVFVVGFGSGFHPSMTTMLTTWLIILLITILATVWFAIRNWSGDYDIVVHRFGKKITLPATNKRKQEVTIPIKDIEDVYVDRNVKTGSDGEEHESFFVRIKVQPNSKALNDKFTNTQTLVKIFDEEKAYRFADWFATDVLKQVKA